MSIIYDALKKAQKSLTSIPKPIISLNIHKNPLNAKKKLYNKNYPLIILFGIILGVLGIRLIMDKSVLRLSFPTNKNDEKDIAKTTPHESTKSMPPQSANTAVTTPSQNLPSLSLNGIVISDNGNVAIVNGRIVDLGDKIEGATVTNISSNEVTIDFEGKEIVLK